jgi:hypothetical protein
MVGELRIERVGIYLGDLLEEVPVLVIDSAVREVLVHCRVWLRVEVSADHEGHVLREDEGLDLLEQRDGLPELDGGASVVGVEVSVHNTDAVRKTRSLRLLLRRTN